MFFYAIQVDQENRMTNFFWRDGKSRTNYNFFGDVICFDTTYQTNKYNMICAPFVGVNHHWKNVLFGCAFLLDETTVSFCKVVVYNYVLCSLYSMTKSVVIALILFLVFCGILLYWV